MNILGIETSCDETATAVVKNGRKILSNVVATSSEMHTKTGGIIPEQAAREQIKSVIPVIEQSLITAFGNKLHYPKPNSMHNKIDAIAVTVGPGLIGSLLVGVETAKTLSLVWNKPLIPVNHLVGHIYANWLENNEQQIKTGGKRKPRYNSSTNMNQPQFPALALVVSGGHTDMVFIKKHGDLAWIGGTRDDAAGEAFDKTARLLGLPYPGGPSIASQSEKFMKTSPRAKLKLFPRPMIHKEGFDWSFSGLKTSVLREIERKKLDKKNIQKLAAEVQEAIVEVLVDKSVKAIKKYKPESFLLSGGVAANRRLRDLFKKRINDEKLQVCFHVPPAKYCTDNAAYIAASAYYNYNERSPTEVSPNPQMPITR